MSLCDAANTTRLSRFRLHAAVSGGDQAEFYPSLSDLEAAVLSVADVVGEAMKKVPGTWL